MGILEVDRRRKGRIEGVGGEGREYCIRTGRFVENRRSTGPSADARNRIAEPVQFPFSTDDQCPEI